MTQMIIAGAIGLLVSIFITPWLIRKFSAVGIGQEIREEGPKSHLRKRGTPTMGGIAILIGITVAYVTVDVYGEIANVGGFTVSGLLVLGLTLSLGGLGFADDYIKLVKHRNLGLNKKAKLIGQFVIALAFGIMIRLFPNEVGLTPGSTHLSFLRDLDTVDLAFGGGIFGMVFFLLFMYLLISAWSNAVNLTDGLDGLASGATAFVILRRHPPAGMLQRSGPPGPGCIGCRRLGRLHWLPLVECGTCKNLHGRHRLPGSRRPGGWPVRGIPY